MKRIVELVLVGSLVSINAFANTPSRDEQIMGGTIYYDGSTNTSPGEIGGSAAGAINAAFNPGPAASYDHIRNAANNLGNQATNYANQAASLQATVQQAKQYALSRSSTASVPAMDDQQFEQLLSELPPAPDPHIDLGKIPDPREQDLPYQLRSNDGAFRDNLIRIEKDLFKANPFYENRKQARSYGLLAVEEADTSMLAGNTEEANFYGEMAQGFLDITVGLDPITGIARSSYELYEGRNLITGAKLSKLERSMAFVGIVTFGGSKYATIAGKGLYQIFNRAAHILHDRQAVQAAIREGENLVAKAGHLLEKWHGNHKIVDIHTAEHVNLKHFGHWPDTPPFELGSHVVEFTTINESKWVRVHGMGNQQRPWIMRKNAIEGLSPTDIQKKFAIPSTPTHVSDVHVPAGTTVFRGNIQDHGLGGSGNVQYWLSDIKNVNFNNMREL